MVDIGGVKDPASADDSWRLQATEETAKRDSGIDKNPFSQSLINH